MQYGKKLRIIRENLGLSARQVSEQIGYERSDSLTNVERGHYHMSMSKLVTLLDIYGVTPSEFFSDVTTMQIGAGDKGSEVINFDDPVVQKQLAEWMSKNGIIR